MYLSKVGSECHSPSILVICWIEKCIPLAYEVEKDRHEYRGLCGALGFASSHKLLILHLLKVYKPITSPLNTSRQVLEFF